MTDSVGCIRQESPSSSRPGSRKEWPRTQAPEQITEHSSANAKKIRRKSVVISSNVMTDTQSPRPFAKMKQGHEDIQPEGSLKMAPALDQDQGTKSSLMKPSRPAGPSSKTRLTSESEGSSGSAETITPVPPSKRDNPPRSSSSKPKRYSMNKPDAFSFLDSDSPQITPGSGQRAFEESTKVSPDNTAAKNTSPSAQSASSAASSYPDDVFDLFGDHETDRSTSPEHSIDGKPQGRQSGGAEPRMRTEKHRKRIYGTPEMPRGNAQHPHLPPEDLATPRIPSQQYAKHPPRAEKPPLTGYELLASKLSAAWPDHAGPQLRPMYRRFEALNHRLLLHLQDEICELEEQLHRLDEADTQNRRLQHCILPASRRAEYMSGGELQWHKTDTLGKIGFKLEQYNRALASFRDTQYLLVPAPTEVQTYRNYLAKYAPIVDAETRFLDDMDDLICFGFNEEDDEDEGEDASADDDDDEYEEGSAAAATTKTTPISHSRSDLINLDRFHNNNPRRRESTATTGTTLSQRSDILPRRHDHDHDNEKNKNTGISSRDHHQELLPAALNESSSSSSLVIYTSVAAAAAVVVPILTFVVIPGFIGRMTVVCLVGVGTLGALIQARVVGFQATPRETCLCFGLYGSVMAVLAGMIN